MIYYLIWYNDLTGRMAAYSLPALQAVLLAFLVGVGPLIILLVFTFPDLFKKVLFNYLGAFVWVQSWPLGYSVMNYILTASLASAGFSSISIDNLWGIKDNTMMYASTASYLLPAIPLLMGSLIYGLSKTFATASQYLMSNSHSISNAEAGQAVAGNMSFGNASMGNTSFNNTSGNKLDTNFSTSSGQFSYNTPGGAVNTQNGRWKFNR